MRELTCIVCPIGCSLTVEEGPPEVIGSGAAGSPGFTIRGNRCPRGAAYAREEIRAPKRVVTATCAIIENPGAERSLTAPRRIPVKTTAPCPREKIACLLQDIYRTHVSLPVRTGDRIITDWRGSGIDVAAVRDLG